MHIHDHTQNYLSSNHKKTTNPNVAPIGKSSGLNALAEATKLNRLPHKYSAFKEMTPLVSKPVGLDPNGVFKSVKIRTLSLCRFYHTAHHQPVPKTHLDG